MYTGAIPNGGRLYANTILTFLSTLLRIVFARTGRSVPLRFAPNRAPLFLTGPSERTPCIEHGCHRLLLRRRQFLWTYCCGIYCFVQNSKRFRHARLVRLALIPQRDDLSEYAKLQRYAKRQAINGDSGYQSQSKSPSGQIAQICDISNWL